MQQATGEEKLRTNEEFHRLYDHASFYAPILMQYTLYNIATNITTISLTISPIDAR
jgi:hypothetical protein